MKKKLFSGSLSAFISMSVLASNLSILQAHTMPFTDVKDDWATPGIEYCYNSGLMTGKSATIFDPEGDVDRAMMAVVLYRNLGEQEPVSLVHFQDVKKNAYYARAVNWLYEQHMIDGYGNGRYGPADTLTREQMAKILFAYNEIVHGKDDARVDLSAYSDHHQINEVMQEPMAWAAARGIMTGSNGKLNPAGKSSRKMLATVLSRYLQSTITSGSKEPSSSSTVAQNGVKVTKTTTAKAAAQAISSLRKAYPASGRLILDSYNPIEDLAAYEPAELITAPDNFYVLQFKDATRAQQVMAEIENTYRINYIHIDPDIDSSYTYTSWGPEAIHADSLKNRIKQSAANSAKVVAMVDTGVNLHHEMFAGRLIGGYDYANEDNEPQDINGHGTHTAGIVADASYGTDVFILPVQVFAGDSDYAYEITVAKGIYYAIDQEADIINLSLGMKSHSQVIEQAVQEALKRDIIVITAAGNSATDVATFCPAHMYDVISVGAVDSKNKLGWYSNTGMQLDLVGPGSDIISSWLDGNYHVLSGTSMAAPFVSASAAMILMLHPELNCASMELVLRQACTDMGDQGWDPQFGAGLLNLENLT